MRDEDILQAQAILATFLLYLQAEEMTPFRFPTEQEFILSALIGAVYEHCTQKELDVGYKRGEKMIYPKFEGQMYKIFKTAVAQSPDRLSPKFLNIIEDLIRPDWREDEAPGRESWTLLYHFYNGNASGSQGFCPFVTQKTTVLEFSALEAMATLKNRLDADVLATCKTLMPLMAKYLKRDMK